MWLCFEVSDNADVMGVLSTEIFLTKTPGFKLTPFFLKFSKLYVVVGGCGHSRGPEGIRLSFRFSDMYTEQEVCL